MNADRRTGYALPQATDVLWADVADTPSILVDLDVVEANIENTARHLAERGLANRPHIKTHKLPDLAHAQIAAGAAGVTCQTLFEAEVMADAGISDILISYNVLGAAKHTRLADLAARAKITVTADSAEVVVGLSGAMSANGAAIDVLVELDCGMKRCGVRSADEAAALATLIDGSPGLTFAGVMGYPPPDNGRAAAAALASAASACRDAGLDVRTVSSGGTPDLRYVEADGVMTEYRPGSYIYNDRSLVARGACTEADCALTVLTTVIGVYGSRITLDAGSKSLSADLFGLTGHGLIRGLAGADIHALSEEHGHVLLGPEKPPRVGDRLRVIPNHACVVTHLFDEVILVRGDRFAARKRVEARGRG